ncbi:hypothetical protein AKJ16_DCAP23341 [Drosera capensis]
MQIALFWWRDRGCGCREWISIHFWRDVNVVSRQFPRCHPVLYKTLCGTLYNDDDYSLKRKGHSPRGGHENEGSNRTSIGLVAGSSWLGRRFKSCYTQTYLAPNDSQRTVLFFSLFSAVIFGWAEYILSYYKQNEELLDPTVQVKIFFRNGCELVRDKHRIGPTLQLGVFLKIVTIGSELGDECG